MAKAKKVKVLTTKEILLRGQAQPNKQVFVKALNGYVNLENITFMRLCELREQYKERDDYLAAMVAETVGLSFEEAKKLQENGLVFAEIFGAVNSYIGGELEDETLKN